VVLSIPLSDRTEIERGDFTGAQVDQMLALHLAIDEINPSLAVAGRGAARATLEASVSRWNIDSPQKQRPTRIRKFLPQVGRRASFHALGMAQLVQPI